METSYQQSSLTLPNNSHSKNNLPSYHWSVSNTLTALDSAMPPACERHGFANCGESEPDEPTLDQDMIRDVYVFFFNIGLYNHNVTYLRVPAVSSDCPTVSPSPSLSLQVSQV